MKTKEPTISDAFDYYFATKRVKKSTIGAKHTLLNQLKQASLDSKAIKDVNGATMRSFIASLGLADTSSHAVYIRLKTVLDHYINDHGLEISTPKKLIKPGRFEVDDDAYLTWDELKALLSKKPETPEEENEWVWVHFFGFMCLTGMAVGDALRFDPEKHIKGNWIKYKRQKTSSVCVLPLFDVTRSIIEKIQWPVRYSSRTVQNKCSGLISELVGRPIKSHGGRKTFGAICLEMGYSMESIAKFMGHSNPMITAQIYAKVTEAKIEREMREMPDSAKAMMNFIVE